MQGPHHPILRGASIIPICQTAEVSESPFDLELVKRMMREQKVSQTALARIAGITSQSAISNILLGKRQVKVHEAARIYDFFGLKLPMQESDVQWIPVIGIASAGAWREAIHDPQGRRPLPRGSVGSNAFAVKIAGDSMNLVVPEGAVVVIDPDQRDLFDKRSYLIANEAGEITVKQYRVDPARFVPLSDNPAHKCLPIGTEQFQILGRAVHTIGDL